MRRQGHCLIALGLLLIAGALVLVLHNRAESDRAGEASEAILKTLLEVVEENGEGDPYDGVSWDPGSWNEALDDADHDENDADEIPEMEVSIVDGYGCIGVIEIPSEGISLPVMADWDLTLFTCNLGGQTRCAVRCLQVE